MKWYRDQSSTGLTGGYAHQCDDDKFGEARIIELPDRESATLKCQRCGTSETLGSVELPEIWLQEPRSVAEIIRDMRLSEAGRTQAQFAEEIGVTTRAVRAWEASDYMPRGAHLAALRMLMPKELVAELMDAWRREKASDEPA